jgi:uncharacterized protein (TIGR02145 family)
MKKYYFSLLFILCIFFCAFGQQYGSFKDTRDGKVYKTVKIGNQEWMAEDLKTTVYNNGDGIYEAKNEKQWKEYSNKKMGCYRKLNNSTYVYNGFAIRDKRGIIPTGYGLPKYQDFKILMKFLGDGDSQSGKSTKSLATYPIYIEDFINGDLETVEIKTNGASRFNAKKGGFVYDIGSLGNEGNCSYWWTSSLEGNGLIVVDIGYCSQDLGGGKGSYPLTFGFAVRAIKK